MTTQDDRAFEKIIAYPYGTPQNPLNFEALHVKFKNLSKNTLRAKQQNDVYEIIADLENLEDTSQLINRLKPRPLVMVP